MLRHAVVQALGGFAGQSPEAVRLIETRLEDDSPYVRNAAVTALGGLGSSSQQHLAQFISALSDASEQVRSAAVRAIGGLGVAGGPALPALLKASRTSQSESLFFLKPVIAQLGREEPARVVPLLVAAMNDEANSVSGRVFAAETLGWVGPRAASALPELQKTSTDGPDQLRRAARDAVLAVIPDTLESSPEGLSRAIQMLADDNRSVRDRGAVALTHAGSKAVPLLLETLRKDTRDRVRIATIHTLSGICQAASSATPVIQQIAKNDGAMELRNAAIYALGYMSDCLPASQTAPVVETLTGALGTASLRLAAIESLGHMHGRGAAAIPAIREILERALSSQPRDDRTVLPCLAALGAIGPPAQTAAAQVLPLLGDPDPAMRGAALGALGGMPVQEAVTTLIKALHDPLDAVRDSASRSISTILSTPEGQAYRPTIVPALVAQMKDPEHRVREAVLSALVASKAGEAVQAVIGALSDSSNVVRWEAAGGLAAFFQNPGDRWIKEAALPALIRSLGDPDGGVVMYAALSLKACGAVCVSALPALHQTFPHADSLASRAITDAIEALEPKPQAPPK